MLRLLTTAVRYWAAYPGEVDAKIIAAEQAWLRERRLLVGKLVERAEASAEHREAAA